MKRTTLTLAMTLTVVLTMTTMGRAMGWGLPAQGFYNNIDRALMQERWGHHQAAMEFWQKAASQGETLLKGDTTKRISHLMGTASAYYHMGNYDRAMTLYKETVKDGNSEGNIATVTEVPWAYVYMGLSCARKGDETMARTCWKQVPFTIGHVYAAIQRELAQSTQNATQMAEVVEDSIHAAMSLNTTGNGPTLIQLGGAGPHAVAFKKSRGDDAHQPRTATEVAPGQNAGGGTQ